MLEDNEGSDYCDGCIIIDKIPRVDDKKDTIIEIATVLVKY